jgi:hypothetical protein
VALTRTATIADELEQVHHRISERAYELSRTSGSSNSPDENWLKAERFPDAIDPAKVTAECQNGLLTVTSPVALSAAAKEAVRPRRRR